MYIYWFSFFLPESCLYTVNYIYTLFLHFTIFFITERNIEKIEGDSFGRYGGVWKLIRHGCTHAKVVAPPQPLIGLLLATWSSLKRGPHSSTIDLFVCKFKNYKPLIAGSPAISLLLIVGRSKCDVPDYYFPYSRSPLTHMLTWASSNNSHPPKWLCPSQQYQSPPQLTGSQSTVL